MATVGTTGRNLILKIGDGEVSETFTEIAVIRDLTVTESNDMVDTTTKDDDGVRTLLGGLNGKSVSVSGSGVFTDSANVAALIADFRAGTLRNFQIDVASTAFATNTGETLEGAFQATQFEIVGNYNDAINFSFTLESSGAVTSS